VAETLEVNPAALIDPVYAWAPQGSSVSSVTGPRPTP
jgi:hypothetical protein